MSFGIDVVIDISLHLHVHNAYVIISLASNIAIDKLSWNIGGHAPVKQTARDNGKSLDLYFLRCDVAQYCLNNQVVQQDFVGINLLDYISAMTITDASNLVVEDSDFEDSDNEDFADRLPIHPLSSAVPIVGGIGMGAGALAITAILFKAFG